MRVDCSLGGFARVSRETAKRAIQTLVLIEVCGLAALDLALRRSQCDNASMNAKLILPLIALLALPASAWPDAGFPQPNLDIKFRFENLDQYPDHDFYLKYGLGRGNPQASLRWTKLASGTLTKLEGTGNRVTSIFLVALPRGTPPPPTPKEDRNDWFSKAPPGGLQSAPLLANNGDEVTYRAILDAETLRAEFVDSANPWQRTLMLIGGGCLTVFVLFVFALVLLVRWLFVRAKKAPRPTDGSMEKA